MIILTALMWLAIAYVLWSFIEYVAHRWPMHNSVFARYWFGGIFWESFESHAMLHHGRFYDDFEREDDIAAKYVSMELSAAKHIVGSCWIWGPLAFWSPIGAACIALMGAIEAIIWTAVHKEMHWPSAKWFTKNPIYRFLRNNHYMHHENCSGNFNAALPLMDWLFGTYRRMK